VGKTRLLEELAREALRSGHLPLLLGTSSDDPAPRDLNQLARGLARAMRWLGLRVLRLDDAFGAQLNWMARRDLTENNSVPGEEIADLADALEIDSDRLRSAAKARYPALFADTSRIIMLLDNLGQASVPLLTDLFDRRYGFNAYGLGSSACPIPVVLVVEASHGPGIGRDLVSGAKSEEWLISRELGPFTPRSCGHVFISYVRDDSKTVDRLQRDLENAGVEVWRDRTSLGPGDRWKDSIRRAITDGAFFICCFSKASRNRTKSYMNEELTLAIEELRVRTRGKVWFLPVVFPGGEVPDWPISAGENLNDFHCTFLSPSTWTKGVNALILAIQKF